MLVNFVNNQGTEFFMEREIVKGFSIHEKPTMLINQGPEYELKLWIEGRWWVLGEYTDKAEAEKIGRQVMGQDNG